MLDALAAGWAREETGLPAGWRSAISCRTPTPGPESLHAHLPGHRHHHLRTSTIPRVCERRLRGRLRAAVRGHRAATCGRTRSTRSPAATSGNNTGTGQPRDPLPAVEQEAWTCGLMLKGGGCENVGVQYACPTPSSARAATWRACAACVLDAVHQAQGLGCAPGVLGVGIGGDRAHRLRRAPRSSSCARSTTSTPTRAGRAREAAC